MIKLTTSLLISLLLAANAFASYKGRVEISIPAEVEIKAEVVRLGAIAEIKGEQADCDLLAGLQIGKSAVAGNYRLLKADRIRVFLKRKGWENISLNAPTQIKVWTSSLTLKPEAIASEVSKVVDSNMPWTKGMAVVKVVPSSRELSLPLGKLSINVDFPANFKFLGKEHLKVEIKIDGEKVKSLWLKTDIKVYKEIVIATRPILRNEIIAESDVMVEKKLIASLRQRVFSGSSEIVGMKAKRAVQKGAMIVEGDISLPAIIKRGGIVEILYQKGSLYVSTRGKALEKGYRGKAMKVENISSRKILLAEVLDSKTVKVNF